ncbi:MAG: DUF3634 family protein [Myxococcota bacterium]
MLTAVGWGIYKVATGGLSDARFVIKVGAGGVTVKGTVPGKALNEVTDFVEGLELDEGAKIWGVPDGDSLRLRFAGGIPDNLQQRMRNYFMN